MQRSISVMDSDGLMLGVSVKGKERSRSVVVRVR